MATSTCLELGGTLEWRERLGTAISRLLQANARLIGRRVKHGGLEMERKEEGPWEIGEARVSGVTEKGIHPRFSHPTNNTHTAL